MRGSKEPDNKYTREMEAGALCPGNDKADWLWGFLLHSEDTFNNRTNFFLVAESMLLVSYVTVPSTASGRYWLLAVIVFLGFAFTVPWLCVQWRAYKNMGGLGNRVAETIPEYREIRADRASAIKANFAIGIVLPIVTLLAWIAILLVFLLCR